MRVQQSQLRRTADDWEATQLGDHAGQAAEYCESRGDPV